MMGTARESPRGAGDARLFHRCPALPRLQHCAFCASFILDQTRIHILPSADILAVSCAACHQNQMRGQIDLDDQLSVEGAPQRPAHAVAGHPVELCEACAGRQHPHPYQSLAARLRPPPSRRNLKRGSQKGPSLASQAAHAAAHAEFRPRNKKEQLRRLLRMHPDLPQQLTAEQQQRLQELLE